MADTDRKYYVICQDKCLFESMTKEQILTAITQAVESHTISDVDAGFVTKIKEQNSGEALSFWVGTNAQYNALTEKPKNCFCIITDDTTKEDLLSAIKQLQKQIETFRGIPLNVTDGATTVDVSQFNYFILKVIQGDSTQFITLDDIDKTSLGIFAGGRYRSGFDSDYILYNYNVIFTKTGAGYTVNVRRSHKSDNVTAWETPSYTDIIGYIRGL